MLTVARLTSSLILTLFLATLSPLTAAAGDVCEPTDPCCETDGQSFRPEGHVCDAARGLCEDDAKCTGYSAACPELELRSTSYACRKAEGACDETEFCDGGDYRCPTDHFKPVDTQCRRAVNACDIAEVCNGDSKDCPADEWVLEGSVCRAALPSPNNNSGSTCDLRDTCSSVFQATPAETASSQCIVNGGEYHQDGSCTFSDLTSAEAEVNCTGNGGVWAAEACTFQSLPGRNAEAACMASGGTYEPGSGHCKYNGVSGLQCFDARKPVGTECRPPVDRTDSSAHSQRTVVFKKIGTDPIFPQSGSSGEGRCVKKSGPNCTGPTDPSCRVRTPAYPPGSPQPTPDPPGSPPVPLNFDTPRLCAAAKGTFINGVCYEQYGDCRQTVDGFYCVEDGTASHCVLRDTPSYWEVSGCKEHCEKNGSKIDDSSGLCVADTCDSEDCAPKTCPNAECSNADAGFECAKLEDADPRKLVFEVGSSDPPNLQQVGIASHETWTELVHGINGLTGVQVTASLRPATTRTQCQDNTDCQPGVPECVGVNASDELKWCLPYGYNSCDSSDQGCPKFQLWMESHVSGSAGTINIIQDDTNLKIGASEGVDEQCDIADTCEAPGGNPLCPTDKFQSDNHPCGPNPADATCTAEQTHCPGIPGGHCPAPKLKPRGEVCRGSTCTQEQIDNNTCCNPEETCNGGSAYCPVDRVSNEHVSCRPADDVCQAPAFCPGTGAEHCFGGVCLGGDLQKAMKCPEPSFLVDLVCRPSRGVCDVPEKCVKDSPTCPQDKFVADDPTLEQVCRPPAHGGCDIQESCVEHSPTCPQDNIAADGTICDDGASCTENDECVKGFCRGVAITCGDGILQMTCAAEGAGDDQVYPIPIAEQCDDGNLDPDDGCDERCQAVIGSPCPTILDDDSCKSSGISKLQIRDMSGRGKDSFTWHWLKGKQLDVADFGDPRIDSLEPGATDYTLCVYQKKSESEGYEAIARAAVGSGGKCGLGNPRNCWRKSGKKSFKYRNHPLTAWPSGVTKIDMKAGSRDRRSKMVFQANGAFFPLPSRGGFGSGVEDLSSLKDSTLQLRLYQAGHSSSGTGLCLKSTFKMIQATATRLNAIQKD